MASPSFLFGHCRPICRPITLQSYRSHFHLFCRRRPAAIKSRRTFHAVDISCFFFGRPKKKKGRRLGSSQRDFLPLLQSDSISHYEGNCAPENRYISNFFFSTVCASHRNKHRPKDVTYVQVVGRCQRTRFFFKMADIDGIQCATKLDRNFKYLNDPSLCRSRSGGVLSFKLALKDGHKRAAS